MSSNEYFNNLVSVNDIFYTSHRDLLERALIYIGQEDRVDEVVDRFLDNQHKMKAKKDPNKPRRNANAYTFFSKDHRATLKKNNGGKKMNFGEMNKALGVGWRKLNDKKRQKYVDLADKDRERYEAEMEQYTANLGT